MSAVPLGPFAHKNDLRRHARHLPELKGREPAKDLLEEILDAVNASGSCFLSDATITRRTGWHRATIRRAGQLLHQLGLVSRIERGAHKGKATVYAVPLIADALPQSVARGATLSDAGGRPAGPQSVAPGDDEASRPGTTKRRAMARHQPHDGTHDGTHHHGPGPHGSGPHGSGSPDGSGAGDSGAPIPRPSVGEGAKAWLGWALAVAASGAGPAATRQAVSEAAGATYGRLGSYGPGVIARPLREAIGGPEADRRRLLAAAANADYLLKQGRPPKEAGIRFMAIWKGTAHPHYEPQPGSEAAEVARQPEPGDGPRRRGPRVGGGELAELARSLAAPESGPVMGPRVGQAEPAPPPPSRQPWIPLDEAERKRRQAGAWERWKASVLGPDGRPPG